MNFQFAIDSHARWKQRLQVLVDGGDEGLDAALVERDDQCELGQWIHGAGASFAGSDGFLRLCSVHARFHRCAAAVVRAALAGRSGEAEDLLQEGGAFALASREIEAAIQALALGTDD